MPHVNFDGSWSIGLRNFALFVVDFFLYGQDIFDRNIISIILHCHWCWYNIFLKKIISSEDSIPQCDYTVLSILGYKFISSDTSKPHYWLFLLNRYVQILFITH